MSGARKRPILQQPVTVQKREETPFKNSAATRVLELISVNATFLIFIGFVYMQHAYSEITHKPYMFMWITYSLTNTLVIVDLLSRLISRQIDLLPWILFCGMCSGMYILTATLFGLMAPKLNRDGYVILTAFVCSITGLAFLVDWATGLWKVTTMKKSFNNIAIQEARRTKSRASRITRTSRGNHSISNAARSTTYIPQRRRSNTGTAGTCPRHESLARINLAMSHPEGATGKMLEERVSMTSYGHNPPLPKKPRIPTPAGCCLTSWSQLENATKASTCDETAQDENLKSAAPFVREQWRKPQPQWAQCMQVQQPSRVGYLVPLTPARIRSPASISKSPPSTPASFGPAPPKKPKWSSKILGIV